MSQSATVKAKSIEELKRLESLWRRCAKGWFLLHWVLLCTNIAAAIAMLVGNRFPEFGFVLTAATIYVPVSTIVIATLKPSSRATTFIVAYRMLYFALLRQQSGNFSLEKTISVAEQAESHIHRGGYMPSNADVTSGDKQPSAIEQK